MGVGGVLGAETIPFTLDDEVPLIAVDVFVNEKGPFRFVLDTGASLTMAAPALVRRAGIRMDKLQNAHALGIEGPLPVKLGHISSLRIGGVSLSDLSVGVSSLRPLNQGTRLNIQGILGFNFLRHFRITIDYVDKVLCFRSGGGAASQ
jgi:predicted aspartyl protease